MRITSILFASLLAASVAATPFAAGANQEKAADPSHDMKTMQHGHHGFMQQGMHHAVAKGVTLDANVDMASHTVTLREGPMNLPQTPTT